MGIPLRATAAGPGWSSWWEQTVPGDAPHVVDRAWSGVTGRDGWLRVFPDGCADLTWDGRRLLVVPATIGVRWVRLMHGATTDGVRLRCGAARAVLGAAGVGDGPRPLRETGDVDALERDLRAAGQDAARRRGLLLAWVTDRAAAAGPPVLPAAVVDRIAGDAPGAEVADALGVSDRTLRREVRASTGTGPKQLARVLRFRRFLVEGLPALGTGDDGLAVVAAALGYADQSHLGRECRALAGSTPAALLRAWRRAGGPVSGGLVAESVQTRS